MEVGATELELIYTVESLRLTQSELSVIMNIYNVSSHLTAIYTEIKFC